MYQDDGITGGQCKNISARDHTRTDSFDLRFGIINNIISFQQTVRDSCFLSGISIDKDRSITAPDKAIMEVHPKKAWGNG